LENRFASRKKKGRRKKGKEFGFRDEKSVIKKNLGGIICSIRNGGGKGGVCWLGKRETWLLEKVCTVKKKIGFAKKEGEGRGGLKGELRGEWGEICLKDPATREKRVQLFREERRGR